MTTTISFIIVSYNTCDLTLACLDSLQRLLGTRPAESFEIVVVDNASTDGSAAAIAARFPAVTLIENDANLGFGAANNQALRQAQGTVIALVNSDAAFVDGDLDAMLAFIDDQPQIGMVGPKIIYPGGDIQTSNNAFPNLQTEILRVLGVARLIRSQWLRRWLARLPLGRTVDAYLQVYRAADEIRRVDWVAASVVFVRRAVIEADLLFDDSFHMYYEDTDWCQRVADAGWQIWYNPALTFSHLADRAPGKAQYDQFEDANRQRSKLLYFQRHAPWFSRLALRIVLLAGAVYRLLVHWQTERRTRLRQVFRLLMQHPL